MEYPLRDMEHCFLHFDDMRAADCKDLAEKPEGVFDKMEPPSMVICYPHKRQ